MGLQRPKIKLVALDMDGTLLNEKGEVTRENREAIRRAQEKGLYVIISTGRSRLTCHAYAKALNLLSYLITVNGSEIWEEEGKLLERSLVQSKLVNWMWELSQIHQVNYWATSVEQVWRNEMPGNILAHQWLKFGYDIEDDHVRKMILQELTNHPLLEVSNSSPTNIEINAAGINKAQAINRVCQQLNLSMENVMAIGDSLNDMAMIKKAGFGVAMGNAQEIVKQSADWVTDSNRENGVAEAFNRWIL